jgi:hypothetical protein
MFNQVRKDFSSTIIDGDERFHHLMLEMVKELHGG